MDVATSWGRSLSAGGIPQFAAVLGLEDNGGGAPHSPDRSAWLRKRTSGARPPVLGAGLKPKSVLPLAGSSLTQRTHLVKALLKHEACGEKGSKDPPSATGVKCLTTSSIEFSGIADATSAIVSYPLSFMYCCVTWFTPASLSSCKNASGSSMSFGISLRVVRQVALTQNCPCMQIVLVCVFSPAMMVKGKKRQYSTMKMPLKMGKAHNRSTCTTATVSHRKTEIQRKL